ncbi:hypothetical protein RJT34_04486 [Clitoria ternatea]|uniref:Isoflavone synthase n=1 Tax=Clitoria ternatea TaxID=43366 RepID=A0AAN9Q2A5_CLITE
MLLELALTFLAIALFMHLRPKPTAKSKALRHLPNPPSPKPRLPFVGHLHLLDQPLLHQSLIRLSERYGPLYSLYFGSMPTVVASTPELFKLFLQTHEASSFNTRFQTSAIRRLTYDNSVAMVPFGPYWKFIRKVIMNDLLNATTVNKLRPLRSQEIRKVLRVLAQSSETQKPLNVTEELLKWTNSTISMMMLGESEEIRDIAREVLKIFGEYSLTDFIWPLKKLRVGKYEQRIDEIFNKYDPVIEKVIKKRQEIRKRRKERNGEVEEGEQSVVFLDTLLQFAEDETMDIKITKEQIKGLVVDFFSAGTDSTAVATDWALSELINNPRVLQKAREEVESVVGMATLLASVIQCFDLQVMGPQGKILKGNDAKVSMEESPGLTVPRANNLVCVPLMRTSIAAKLLS